MAILALQSSATALSALNTRLDVTANNLANVNTDGFKASRANFQDLLYVERAQPGVENSNGDQRPIGLYVGLGVRVSGTQVDFTQGSLITTGRDLDIAIEGDGFFQVQVPTDTAASGIAYTRAGNFTLDSDGRVVMASDQGRRIIPEITIPPEATKVDIKSDGRVYVEMPGTLEPELVETLQTATFVNPPGLKQIGENLFTETAASGDPDVGDPNTGARGNLRAGMLEASNVDPTNELIDMIRTQRAFEMNSNTIRAADDTLRMIAQLRR